MRIALFLQTNMATLPYAITATSMAGGVAGVTGQGPTYQVTLDGNWVQYDQYVFDIITASQTIELGANEVTGLVPIDPQPVGDKIQFVAGQEWIFSAVDSATGFAQQDIGAGQVSMATQVPMPDNMTGLCLYQGRLALLARRFIQIWTVNDDPTQQAIQQVLLNIGTLAPLSIQGLGQLDVLFLSDTGIRSLRIHDITLNASVNDIGSPVDSLVLADLRAISPTTATNACAIVEPASGRYWLYLNNDIYVYSYYPQSKIQAWSKYTPQMLLSNVVTAFVPQKFLVYQGQVYGYVSAGGNNYAIVYGGTNNATWDASVQAEFESPWLDAKKPATKKTFSEIDYAITGPWQIYFGYDYRDELTALATDQAQTVSSYDQGAIPVQGIGTHFKVKATCTGASTMTSAPLFSAAAVHFTEGDEK